MRAESKAKGDKTSRLVGVRHIERVEQPILPLTNYSLSTECPACGAPTYRLACKVRCKRCGFMWDCSEL